MQEPSSGDGLATRSSAYGALRWILAGSVLQRVVSIAALAIIARLITRDSYGVFRELLSLHLICFVLLPVGFDQLYMREVNDRQKYAAALRSMLLVSSVVLVAVIWALQPVLVKWLKLQSYGYLLFTFPFALAFQAAKLSHKVLLATRLSYRPIQIAELTNTTITMCGGALLLLWWRSPAALYVAYAVGECAEYLALRRHRVHDHSTLQSGFSELRELDVAKWRFAAFASGDQALNVVSSNAPVLILGGALSHDGAASFSMASSLITLPLFVLVGAMSRVALPSLAGRSESDLQARTLEILSGAAAYIVPVLIGVALYARPIVYIVLGENWVEHTTPLVQWLVLYCVFIGLFSPISSLDVIRDRMDIGFGWNATTFVFRLAALLWGYQHGLVAAVAAFSIVSAIMWLVNGVVLGWLLRCGWWKFHCTWLKFAPAWALLVIISLGCLRVAGSNPWVVATTCIIPGALYMAVIHKFYPSAGKLLTRLVLSTKVKNALSSLRRGESTDLPTGGGGAGIP